MTDVIRRPRGFEEVKAKFPDARQNGESYNASCVLTGHNTPAGHVTLTDAGDKALITCHGGKHTYQDFCTAWGYDTLTYSNNGHKPALVQRKEEAIYQYIDANGKPFEVVRTNPKGFYQRRPDGNGGYIYNLDGIVRTLYHNDELQTAIEKGTAIFHPEGEKDVDSLRIIGLTATCNSGGAGKWLPQYTAALKDADLVIIPDNDKPGYEHALQVAQACYGIAKRIRILKLPGLPDKGDVSDWLNSGGNDEKLKALVDASMDWVPSERPIKNSFRLTRLAELYGEPEEDIEYLWDNTLIKGGLSILVAKPKLGKSTLARNLAYALAKGEPLFLGRRILHSGPVVYLALEEKRSEIKKHFQRMGAAEYLPIFIHTGSAPDQAIGELRKAIIESEALLAIVDPLQRLVRIKDLNNYSEVSLTLEPLMQIARDTTCHILSVHHTNKGISKDDGDSILGSTAIFGSVDCALIMKRSEACRTIESIQRYGMDLPRTVLNFDVETGLTTTGGTLEAAEMAACGKAILELLSDHKMAEKDIKDAITDYKGGIVSKTLRILYQDDKIHRQGHGKKGDPYLYSSSAGNAGDSGDEHMEIPTIPTISNNSNSFKNDIMQVIQAPSNAMNPNPQHLDSNPPNDGPP